MKKLFAILVTVIFVGSLHSCKPREKCPAYGYKKNTVHTQQAAG